MQCKDAYDDSIQRGGAGTGVLRIPGRRRVMEVTAALGETPAGSTLLKAGLRDDDPVALAAAAGLVQWGDDAAIPVLFEASLTLPQGDPDRRRALQALQRAAQPKRREAYLGALSAQDPAPLRKVLLATFPTDKEKRIKALRAVVERHPNPYARRFALDELAELKDPGALRLARAILADDQPVVRPAALRALGKVGGDKAGQELEDVLRGDPKFADEVARGLFAIGTQDALGRAVSLLTSTDLKPATRAAVARSFFARMRDDTAPGLYRQRASLDEALSVLREVIDEDLTPVTVAAVEAIGRIGDRGADVEPLLGLLQDPSAEVAPAVLGALGHLGGEFAAAKLVELLRDDPDLRPHAVKALASFRRARDVPVDELLDMLESDDLKVRAAAHEALMGLRRSTDPLGFDPAGAFGAREAGIQRWKAWWAKRSG
jgi:HEAT repeat protein